MKRCCTWSRLIGTRSLYMSRLIRLNIAGAAALVLAAIGAGCCRQPSFFIEEPEGRADEAGRKDVHTHTKRNCTHPQAFRLGMMLLSTSCSASSSSACTASIRTWRERSARDCEGRYRSGSGRGIGAPARRVRREPPQSLQRCCAPPGQARRWRWLCRCAGGGRVVARGSQAEEVLGGGCWGGGE